MTDASTRTVTVFENQVDTDSLLNNKYHLNVAKAVVSTDGSVHYNILWQSKSPAAYNEVSWPVQYAIKWVAQQFSVGTKVLQYGTWQPCNKGETWQIGQDGFWAAGPSGPASSLQAINNSQQPVTIVVGVYNSASGGYDPIFADPTQLYISGQGTYTPKESVKSWYSAALETGTMIANDVSGSYILDCTSPASTTGKFVWWLNYSTTTGKWTQSDKMLQ